MLIWLALCLSAAGLVLLTLFGFLFPGEASSLADWAYKLGLLLITLGISLTLLVI